MRILIIEVNWLGDVLFSTPAIKALRERFPESHIACLIVPRVKEVLANNPYIDELMINDCDGVHKGWLGKLRLIRELREKKFDMAVLFHRSFTRAALTFWAGIPRRVGYSTWKRRFLLTDRAPMPKKDSLHRVEHYLGIAAALGCDIQDTLYEFFTAEDDERYIKKMLQDEGVVSGDVIVCLNPGGNWFPKRWPKEYFSRLADRLIDECKVKVILSGAYSDINLVREIAGGMKNKPIITAGKTTLQQSAALFKESDVVVSADSGPLHIAAGVGTNVVGLFGPTSALITGPRGKGKIKLIQKDVSALSTHRENPSWTQGCTAPCYDEKCNDNRCMQAITVDEVFAAVKELLR
ncbi:MAG: lipopolysaccharide heptosyltransferase II [Omnitrophica WOR_2 bacterium GWF2_43_52]|nr:MAG: lipopolysaccharide heptosyltransferase II [Omnitrophica WOR_2 bacterium GWC2_44_8]OGX21922.1 MAG: lipopolysaccharide heptosyltransferase II [Omnitrophica WOR_2 bacterium GWF2_43_52]HAH20070.1 lipopolysaccharide heptosyltransferase II [Candidatus Omnitrophota bacterium]HBG63111.1 lipopolysaccharide heptosyltransferase II [Candidatus Omnitrophota bacterium]HCD37792.1 lipopolysaccharide heptosyltransferase II [Candidatus Omnitrophota bacterium]